MSNRCLGPWIGLCGGIEADAQCCENEIDAARGKGNANNTREVATFTTLLQDQLDELAVVICLIEVFQGVQIFLGDPCPFSALQKLAETQRLKLGSERHNSRR